MLRGRGRIHSTPEYRDVRLQTGRMNVRQVGNTSARVVATTRTKCQLQLSDLNDLCRLAIECVSVTELVAKALH